MIDPATTDAADASTQDGLDEEAGDAAEAADSEQPIPEPETPVEGAGQSAEGVTDESPAETGDVPQDAPQASTADGSDAADESGDADESKDADQSDDADQDEDRDAGAGEKSTERQ